MDNCGFVLRGAIEAIEGVLVVLNIDYHIFHYIVMRRYV